MTVITQYSTLLILTWISVWIVPASARRRDPLEESQRRRRLTESQNWLTPDSVRGSRSLAGNVNVPVPKSPDDHLVTDLPLLDNADFTAKHWAGLLPVNDAKDGYLFYWLFAPDPEALQTAKANGMVQQDESNVPLLIWLNGGPACSSMDGLWIENGPFRLQPTNGNWDDIRIDPNSWNRAPAYTLYIDQPVGTGLAFTTSGKYPNNDRRVNEDFYYFLTEFMKLHATTIGVKQQTHGNQSIMTLQRPFYFSGESHAGHYIPSMMNYIRQKNLALKTLKQNKGVLMPLSGAAIGNGWVDPVYQYSAHEAGYGYSLIGKAQERALAIDEEQCRRDLSQQKYTSDVCFGLLGQVKHNALGKNNPQVVSQYDARKFENRKSDRDFPHGHKDVEAYLGQTRKIPNAHVQDVLKAIHATPSWDSGQRYLECTDPPYFALSHQDGLGVVPDVVDLLEHTDSNKIRLLFFNGIHDLICNHVGNENFLLNLPWKHKQDFVMAERYSWKVPSTGAVGGYAKEYDNLLFLKVLDAGHMVPMDVPEVALDMMVTFMYSKGGSFDTYPQGLDALLESRNPSCPACPSCTKQQECPVCNDSDCSCTDSLETTTTTSMMQSPVVKGGLAGVAVFLLFGGIALSCMGLNGSRNQRTYRKAGQIELPGGYRDDDDLDLDGELNDHSNGERFEDEKMQ